MTTQKRDRQFKRGLALLFATSMLVGVSQAHAADDATPAAESSRLEEVTVFARKRAENVQNIPVPITVITAQEIQRENLVNFTDFQNKFPSFSVYLTNPKQLNLGIRGIGNNGFNTDGIDGSVGIFVDGVYSGRQGIVSSDFNDISDVELLRGPQGTLFGKNTTAGAVIINSKKPSFTPEFSAEATLGNEDFKQVKFSASGPLIDGKLAARLSAFYSKKDGNYPNVYGGPDAGQKVTRLREHCAAVGRDVGDIEKTAVLPRPADGSHYAEQLLNELRRLHELGFTTVFTVVPGVGAVTPLETLGEKVIPEISTW